MDWKDIVKVGGAVTLTAVTLGWVLTHASQAAQVSNAAAGGYATAVKAVMPTG